nr:MAG: hypothetical protein [Bacteriophage sp.]
MRGAIPAWARPGTGCLPVDAERRPAGARAASHAIYAPMTASAVQTL